MKAFKYQSIDGAHHFQKAEDQERDGNAIKSTFLFLLCSLDAIISNGAKSFIYVKRKLQANACVFFDCALHFS